MEMDKIEPGMFVKYAYTLTDASNGEVLFEASREQPDEMVYGVSHEVIPGLVATLDGLKEGDRFEVELPPAAAFGDRNEADIIDLDRSIFERDGKLAEEVKEGAKLPMMTAEGYRILGTVLEIGDKVKMDFNHPFAGKTVKYNGEIIEVRPATEEELHPVSGCGGCGGGCGSGDCGGDCGSSENSCGCSGGCCDAK